MSSRTLLFLAAATICIVWQLPYGREMLYPFTLLATFAHEMGHGLTALLVGEEFQSLVLHADGSGMAFWQGAPGRFATVTVAAGGLLAPSVAGVTVLLLSRSSRYGRLALIASSALVVLSGVLWVRNLFGIAFVVALAGAFALCARYLAGQVAQFALHLVGITLCLSWFTDLNYMFSNIALVGGSNQKSDTAIIAQALWLPYWFWGGLIALTSISICVTGLWLATRKLPPA